MSVIQKSSVVFRQDCCSRRLQVIPRQHQSTQRFIKTKPKNFGDVRKLLGMTGYFRNNITNFSKTAEPLYVLLKKADGQSNLSKSRLSWGETQQEALDQLLLCLLEPPILTYRDHNREFILHVDASGKGLGAVLWQYQEGKPLDRPQDKGAVEKYDIWHR